MDDPDHDRDTADPAPTRPGGVSGERRRGLVILLFIALTVALALVLAFFYSMPSAGY